MQRARTPGRISKPAEELLQLIAIEIAHTAGDSDKRWQLTPARVFAKLQGQLSDGPTVDQRVDELANAGFFSPSADGVVHITKYGYDYLASPNLAGMKSSAVTIGAGIGVAATGAVALAGEAIVNSALPTPLPEIPSGVKLLVLAAGGVWFGAKTSATFDLYARRAAVRNHEDDPQFVWREYGIRRDGRNMQLRDNLSPFEMHVLRNLRSELDDKSNQRGPVPLSSLVEKVSQTLDRQDKPLATFRVVSKADGSTTMRQVPASDVLDLSTYAALQNLDQLSLAWRRPIGSTDPVLKRLGETPDETGVTEDVMNLGFTITPNGRGLLDFLDEEALGPDAVREPLPRFGLD
jgi:hypothetical protein